MFNTAPGNTQNLTIYIVYPLFIFSKRYIWYITVYIAKKKTMFNRAGRDFVRSFNLAAFRNMYTPNEIR